MLRPLGPRRVLVLALLGLATALLSGPAIAAPPTNDAFDGAVELTGRSATASSTNKDATKEVGEPDHAGEPGGASVWYRWTAPADGRTTVSTCGSQFDTLLAVYTGNSVSALDEVASNDDSCGLESSISFLAQRDTTYRIAIDGVDGETSLFTIQVRLAPLNDHFADAAELVGDEGTVEGTNVGASREDGEPEYLSSSTWYRWTAPSSGPATFETCGSSFDTTLAVYTGSELEALALVSYSDDACGSSSIARFGAVEGTTYTIAVAGYGGVQGEYTLVWNRNPPPPAPPSATEYPVVTGTAREGETLTGSDGQWLGATPMTFTYAWGRCDAPVEECELIASATARTYTVAAADVGYRLFLRVTATNVAGSGTEYTDVTAIVRSRGPANASPPQVIGRAVVGQVLDASAGTWTGKQPIQYAYQWQACDTGGNDCRDLFAENATTLQVRAVHVERRLRVVVTATNEDGSISVASTASEVVPRPTGVQRPARCVVPSVRGRSLKSARSTIRRAGCTVGAVRRAYSKSVRRGRVVSQTPRAGTRLRRGGKVNLVLSKGRKR